MEYFLSCVTPHTLLVVDELCRSTAVEEGTALAVALCEKCIASEAFVFLTTHFKALYQLHDLYFNVKL